MAFLKSFLTLILPQPRISSNTNDATAIDTAALTAAIASISSPSLQFQSRASLLPSSQLDGLCLPKTADKDLLSLRFWPRPTASNPDKPIQPHVTAVAPVVHGMAVDAAVALVLAIVVPATTKVALPAGVRVFTRLLHETDLACHDAVLIPAARPS
ncbi:hypothetical protein EV356DRAFT_535795 [Viridothelium virens]|uniref:Uncharacterized protein n=1 Tax=Viridothelium virens TaxID=1048519 RepID=A0A6A6GZD2_VIRVR|nr:hypothetical protein EV356DRAFT_535795 [Viridothelium virens]